MRVEEWPDALMAVIQRHADQPFRYGASDCWMLVADAIEAITGNRPFADVRYSTKQGAARTLTRYGFTNVADALAYVLEEIPIANAGRGDVGVVDTPDGPAAVVCAGLYFVCKSETGIDHLPRDAVKRAFGVR
jgi:hypothetical protein